jgi:RHS repeat-associated protein
MTPASFFVNVANEPPTSPAIVSPPNGASVTTLQPTLTISNATDPDLDPLQYEFELDTVSSFNSPNLVQSGPQPAGTSGQTSWLVPQPLADNTHYYWRARSDDGLAVSGWSTASFFVNTVNDPPMVPTLANPPNGSQVASLTPTLSVNNSTDPDGDPLTYRFEVYADPFLLLLVTASPEIAQGATQTRWTVSPALQENHLYWWRVRAKDGHGLTGGWMTTAAFQVNVQNDPPTSPIPVSPILGTSVATATPKLTWLDSLDPELAALTYQVEVYSDSALTKLVASVSNLPGTLLTTSWKVTPALPKVATYYWRVRGSDGSLYSAWSGTQSFKVGKLATGDNLYFATTKPTSVAGIRVATIGGLSGLTGSPSEAIFFYHTDHLGTPLMMTNSTGQVVWQAEYLPFGEVASLNEDVDGDGVKVRNNLRFPGQYYDTETGLHYNMARNYQSMTGRYVEADPVGIDWGQGGISLSDGINHLYGYVHNNPLGFSDPSGLYQKDVHFFKTRDWGTEVLTAKWGFEESRAVSVANNIASADWGMDTTFSTSAWNFPVGTLKHFRRQEDVAQDLWRAIASCDYKTFGQHLHSWQDTYAHAGYSVWTVGHVPASIGIGIANFFGANIPDPDAYIDGRPRDLAMKQTTEMWFRELGKACQCGGML